jgi:serine/threonine protein kinase
MLKFVFKSRIFLIGLLFIAFSGDLAFSSQWPAVEASILETNRTLKKLRSNPKKNRKEIIFFKRFRSALTHLDEYFDSEVSVDSLRKLVSFVESNRRHWHGEKQIPFELNHVSGQKIPVTIELDNRHGIYLDLGKGVFANGESKTFSEIVSYRSWARLSKGEVNPTHLEDSDVLEAFEREKKVSQVIQSFRKQDRVGLPKIYGTGSSTIIQRRYDGDLFQLLVGDDQSENHVVDPEFTREQRLKGLLQLSKGLAKLHSLGILHGDIKAENVFWRKYVVQGKTQFEFVLADFDLSHVMSEELKENKLHRPTTGTIGYAAPEIFTDEKKWRGEKDAQKIENTLRGDVFSLGVLAYEIMTDSAPWGIGEDFKKDTFRDDIDDKILHLTAPDQIDPMNFLIASALNPKPEERISAKQFELGVEHILNRKPDLFTAGSRESVMEANKALSIADIRMAVAKSVLKKHLIAGKVFPGNYFLKTSQLDSSKDFRVSLAFVDSKFQVQVKSLNVNPLDVQAVSNEIEFLKKIGTLTQQLKVELPLHPKYASLAEVVLSVLEK